MIKLPAAKLEQLTDQEHGSLNNLYFDKDHERLIASDGFGMVVIPVKSANNDLSGCIPIEAVKAARQFGGEIDLSRTDSVTVVTAAGKLSWSRPKPEWPNDKDDKAERLISSMLKTEGNCVTVSLDAARLLSLAKALLDWAQCGVHGLTLKICGENDFVLIKPYLRRPPYVAHPDDGRFGILAPMVMDDDQS